MPRFEAQKRLRDNWVNIVLTIISIIQGFGFSLLAQQFLNTLNYSIKNEKYIVLALFVLCLFIILRVFQTYITGVLDYEVDVPNFWELLLVVVIGSLQYYLFSLFEEIPEKDYDRFDIDLFQFKFYLGGIIISFVGALGYFLTLRKVRKREGRRLSHNQEPSEDYKSEIKLQRLNISGMLSMVVIQLFLLPSVWSVVWSNIPFKYGLSDNIQILCVGVTIAILFVNTLYSIRVTFPKDGPLSAPARYPIEPQRERLEIDVSTPEREDVPALCNLLIQHFGYIYSTLFGKDKELTHKMLESILKASGGAHSLGYKSFCIAHPKNRRKEIVGVLLLKLKSSTERYDRFLSALSITKVVLLNLGLRGASRAWRNWRIISGISPEVQADELHIVYLAVSDDALNRNVGEQLLEHTKVIAKKKGKNLISLHVRAKNIRAQEFFYSQGFSIEGIVRDDDADALLGQGANSRMITEVSHHSD